MEENKHIVQLISHYNQLAKLKDKISEAANTIISAYEKGGKLLICGNGGSSSDADHIVGELMKSFEGKRPEVKVELPSR